MRCCKNKNSPSAGFFSKLSSALFSILALIAITPITSYCATQVSQFGITWTFDKDYTVGQFANGDYYVIGPLTITSITPSSVADISGRVKNGTMINPVPVSTTSRQGYDSSMAGNNYDAALNKAFNVSSGNPLVVQPGSSIVSTVSIDTAGNTPQLKTAAILTVLAVVPPAGSFRPPYAGADKSIRYNKSQLNYSLLNRFLPVGNTPALSDVEKQFEKPWIDHRGTAGGRYYHPSDNMPNYGREISTAVGDGALMLQLNFTNQQKETLLVRYVQLGIDLYGITVSGGSRNWEPDGGHASGRKWPIIFAGLMLNDAQMSSIGTISSSQLYFGEDCQTFYVTQADVDLAKVVTVYKGVTYYGHFYPQGCKEYQEYTTADIGLPEWGIRHQTTPLSDARDWDNAAYRKCCTANAWAGFVLAALMMNQKDAWNHDALFDYMDRYMGIEAKASFNRQQSRFAENMWDAYRPLFGPVWPDKSAGTLTLDTISNKTVAENSTLTFSIHASSGTGGTISYSAHNLPSGATFSGSTFTWKPTSGQTGSYSVSFVASDGTNQAAQTITITVTTVNQAPVFTAIENKTAHAGSLLAFTLNATDPDSDTITYSASAMPSGASLSGSTFSWTPATSQQGTYTITFTASDGQLSTNQQLTITVTATNNAPVVGTIPPQTVPAGTLCSFTVSMTDPDADPLVCAAMDLPSGATFQNGIFRWTPTSSHAGVYTICFYASDGQLTTSKNVSITVTSEPALTVIIDNGTTNTASSAGWRQSNAPNPYGGKSVWSYKGATYTWIFKPTVSGTYRVSMWWTSLLTRSNNVPVAIFHNGGTATVYVNQQINGGMWNTLGTYTFNAGTTYKVVLIALGSTSPPSTCADAVKFEKF